MIIWVTGALRRSQVDSEDGFRKGCRNVSRQQQAFSGLHSARWSFSIKVCYSWFQTIFLKCNVVYYIADLHYPWCFSVLFGFPASTKAPRRHRRRHQRKCQTSSSMFPFGGKKKLRTGAFSACEFIGTGLHVEAIVAHYPISCILGTFC